MSVNDLKQGMFIVFENQIYQILEASHSHIGRGGANVSVKMKNLESGAVVSRSFKSNENVEEAEIARKKIEYLYGHRGECWFCDLGDRAKRFSLKEDILGDKKYFLKSGVEIEALKLGEKILNISLPIKMDIKVVDAPPNIRGNTAQGGTKIVTLETGAKVSAPLFVEIGDIIKVNTERGEYVERTEKG